MNGPSNSAAATVAERRRNALPLVDVAALRQVAGHSGWRHVEIENRAAAAEAAERWPRLKELRHAPGRRRRSDDG